MKATLEFNLPEEKEEFDMTNKAVDYYSQLHEIDNYLRRLLKHGDPEAQSTRKLAENIRNMIEIY
jgi:hypothetical protein